MKKLAIATVILFVPMTFACDDTTLSGLAECTFADKAADMLTAISPTATYTLATGTGTFEERFQSRFDINILKSAYTQWKVKKTQSLIGDCSGETGILKQLCDGFKAMGQ